MYREHSVIVVVPAHNEAKHILGVIHTMPPYVDQIVIVDDCSRDDTYATVEGAQDPRVVLLKTPSNAGVGGATMLGYREALRIGADFVVKMDGDGQMSPDHLAHLLDALVDAPECAYAKGNRFLHPDALPSMPLPRLLGNTALTFMTKLATGYWQIFDPQNGFTAIRSTYLQGLHLDQVHQRFFFENDMLVQLSLLEAKVKDVALPARYGSETSSLNEMNVVLTFPPLLLRRFFQRIWHNYVVRDFNPIALFLFLGLLLLGWGAGFGLFAWIRSAVTDSYASTGTVMISVLPFILGFQLLLQAIVLDIQHSPR